MTTVLAMSAASAVCRVGRVGALLFRTYSEQRARASPGQKFDENLGEKNILQGQVSILLQESAT